METKIIDNASTNKTSVNIIEADGFVTPGGSIIGLSAESKGKEVKIISYASTNNHTVNILQADGFQIKGASVATPVSSSIENHAYVPVARTQQDHTDAQKEMIRIYNSMRAKLLEASLMDGKS